MQVMPIQGTCLGHQLLQILASDVNFTELLVPTDSVVSIHTTCTSSPLFVVGEVASSNAKTWSRSLILESRLPGA